MSRKPKIAPARSGASFDGVFTTPPDDVTPPHSDAPQPVPAAPIPPPTIVPQVVITPPPTAKQRAVPAPGDVDYDRTVQTNWQIPNGLRARLRAVRELDGTLQTETVVRALTAYIDALERHRGQPYELRPHHFG